MNINSSSEQKITIFTIGFVKKSAREFFETLTKVRIRKLIDIRLNNMSQLAGYAKKDDLEYFLKAIGNIEYLHLVQLAPTKELLENYRKKKISWEQYEVQYLNLLKEREVEKFFKPVEFDYSCLLCSEAKPDKCHRRLAAEYLQNIWKNEYNVCIYHL